MDWSCTFFYKRYIRLKVEKDFWYFKMAKRIYTRIIIYLITYLYVLIIYYLYLGFKIISDF